MLLLSLVTQQGADCSKLVVAETCRGCPVIEDIGTAYICLIELIF